MSNKIQPEAVPAQWTDSKPTQVDYLYNLLGENLDADIKNAIGRILTIVDASISDLEQRKAVKDLVKSSMINLYRETRDSIAVPLILLDRALTSGSATEQRDLLSFEKHYLDGPMPMQNPFLDKNLVRV